MLIPARQFAVINKIKYAKQDDGLMFGPSLEVNGPAAGVVDLVRGGWR